MLESREHHRAPGPEARDNALVTLASQLAFQPRVGLTSQLPLNSFP